MNVVVIEEVFKTPVKRSELPAIFGCSDRQARDMIRKLSEQYNIVNLQDGSGYVIADKATTKRYAQQEMKRGIAILKKASAMFKRCAEADDDAVVVPVRAHLRTIRPGKKDTNQIELF